MPLGTPDDFTYFRPSVTGGLLFFSDISIRQEEIS